MSPQYRGRVLADGLIRRLERLPSRVAEELGGALDRDGQDWYGAMIGRMRGTGPDSIGTRSRQLRDSLGWRRRGKRLASLAMSVFSRGARHARMQEFGGRIVAKNVRFLTIPLPDNLTAAGVPRFKSAAELRQSGRTWVAKSKAGNLVIRYVPPGKQEMQTLWLLKPFVTIPPRLGFFKTWNEGPVAQRRLDRHRNALARALGAA